MMTKASCCVYLDKHTGTYKIKDFGNPAYAGDCFAFVAKIANLDCSNNFNDILKIIDRNLNLFLSDNQRSEHQTSSVKTSDNKEVENKK